MITGIGRNAKSSSCQEASAKTVPTMSTLSAVCRIAAAPTSRKRSSWLTSSLRVASVVPEEPPARLHGDLWNGNVLWGTDGRVVLVDPAAYGGHREVDLAMLALFGLPQLPQVIAAYHEVAPLTDGWEDRVGFPQLFPLLVHACLFGGGYGARAAALAKRYL